MNYKYPPIYKYGLLLILIFMFFKHQKILTPDKILTYSIAITLFVAVLDYILIKDHPYPLESTENDKKKEDFDETFSDDDIEDIINSYDDESENDNGGDMYNPHVAPTPNMILSNHNRGNRQYYSTNDMYR